MSNWSPKPLRDMNLEGIFSHADSEVVVKSETPNRWVQQRNADGTPHTRHGPSALTPPPAGPKLSLNDLSKSAKPEKAEKVDETLDADEVVKAYLEKGIMSSVKAGYSAGKNAASKVMSAGSQAKGTLASSGATATKGCGPDEETSADDLEKSLAGLRKYF